MATPIENSPPSPEYPGPVVVPQDVVEVVEVTDAVGQTNEDVGQQVPGYEGAEFASLRAVALLESMVEALDDPEERPGQSEMAGLVADAAVNQRHLLVEAGTGVGKSFAYLTGLIAAEAFPAVISTATKALQDQLVKDLPAIADHDGKTLRWAVLKGRQSYVCPAKLQQKYPATMAALEQMSFGEAVEGLSEDLDIGRDIKRLVEWMGEDGSTGERDHAPVSFSYQDWNEISISGMECPGKRCPFQDVCPALKAVERAGTADIVVVNHHLYAAHIASDLSVLPEHKVVVFDEAHKLADTLMAGLGIAITPQRVKAYAGLISSGIKRSTVKAAQGRALVHEMFKAAEDLESYLTGLSQDGVDLPIGGEDAEMLRRVVSGTKRTLVALSNSQYQGDSASQARTFRSVVARSAALGEHIIGDISLLLEQQDDTVAWSDGRGLLRSATVDVGKITGERLLSQVPTIMCSATLTLAESFGPFIDRLGYGDALELDEIYTTGALGDMIEEAGPGTDRVGAGNAVSEKVAEDDAPYVDAAYMGDGCKDERVDQISRDYYATKVATPFNYGIQGLLYVPKLPLPKEAGWGEATDELICELLSASGGRALILTTSFGAVDRISAAVAAHSNPEGFGEVLVQGKIPRKELIERFSSDRDSSLIATMGFWEGIDVPGHALQLLIVDRIPFPRPNDPLFVARRKLCETQGKRAFAYVDLPRAAMLLAQGTGRLIRHSNDEGVVVICDGRLANARYGRTIIESLPPFTGTQDHVEVIRELNRLRDAG